MLSQSVQSAYQFFFLLTLNEETARDWTNQCSFATKKNDLSFFQPQGQIEFVLEILKVLNTNKFQHRRNQVLPASPIQFWPLPEAFLKLWVKLCKRASLEEINALILNGLLGFSIEVISESMQVPEGTIRFRLGHGYRKLGTVKLESIK